MSSLSNLYIKKETLEDILKVLNKRGEKGINFTISINDETNKFGQNVTGFISQSKEEREAKKPKYYTGNGKVFWTDGTIKKAEKVEKVNSSSVSNNDTPLSDDDLPF